MPGESQETPSSPPDPSVRALEQLEWGLRAERDWTRAQFDVIRQRLADMDRATEVLNENINRVPTQLQEAIEHVRELDDEKFESIAKQFAERDTRGEREVRDNTLKVDAAFAAQEKSAAKQDEANQKTIDKLEANLADQINKQQDLSRTENKALSDKIDDIKADIGDIKQQLNGAIQNRAGGNESTANIRAAVTIGITVMLFLLTAAGFIIALTAK